MGVPMAVEMFGQYRLDELIGRGGMGEVYRAFDTARGRIVAIKRLPAQMSAEPEFRRRFEAEAALAARLNHPHIIPIHNFGEIDGRLYIDMRLVEGTDLATVLARQGPLRPVRAQHVIAQVAAALDAAHDTGMVHSDIKPSNILMANGLNGSSDADFVYLTDFGIAEMLSEAPTSLTDNAATAGSLQYMAPERFTNSRRDRRVDVYALGCLLFEVLTARKPFVAQDHPALMHAHLNMPPPRPSDLVPGLPAGLNAVVAQAMAKDPEHRYPTAGDLAAAVRAAVEGGGRQLPPAEPPWTTGVIAGTGSTGAAGEAEHPTSPGSASPQAPVNGQTPARRRHRRVLVALSALAVLLVIVGAGVVAFRLWPGRDVTEVRTEPDQTMGANPFMPPIGQDQPGVTPPGHAGGSYPGNTPGLYGGTRNQASCDPNALVAFLQSHPDKAAAWAAVEGIAVSDIPSYVARLTPVVQRSDTAVTNHGFSNGRPTVIPAVLQAGTAVLVDEAGVPRAKCYCGNPLTPPAVAKRVRYRGATWATFTPSEITRPQPASQPISWLPMADLTQNRLFWRHVGSHGEQDRLADPGTPTLEGTWTLTRTLVDCVHLEHCEASPTNTIRFTDCTDTQCTYLAGGTPQTVYLNSGTWSTSHDDPRLFYCTTPQGDTTWNTGTIGSSITVTSSRNVNGAQQAETFKGTQTQDASTNPPTCQDNPHITYEVTGVRSATSSATPTTTS